MPYLYQELKTLSPLFAPIEACFYSSDQSDYLVYLLISVYVIYTSFGGCFGKWVIFNIILHVIVALCAATVVEDNYNLSLSLANVYSNYHVHLPAMNPHYLYLEVGKTNDFKMILIMVTSKPSIFQT